MRCNFIIVLILVGLVTAAFCSDEPKSDVPSGVIFQKRDEFRRTANSHRLGTPERRTDSDSECFSGRGLSFFGVVSLQTSLEARCFRFWTLLPARAARLSVVRKLQS